ncbi:MAG: 7-carboxy-7-deazaguanine synthase QueE [Candidatus Aenigmatarchaeota archaeon]
MNTKITTNKVKDLNSIESIERLYHYKLNIHYLNHYLKKNYFYSLDSQFIKKFEEELISFFGEGSVAKVFDDKNRNYEENYETFSCNYYIPYGKRIEPFLLKISVLLNEYNDSIKISFQDLSKNSNNLSKFLSKEYRYSEIFGNTFQGEGKYTGVNTIWYRSWGCNFNCNGFGQTNPYDPSTWKLDYQDIDPSKYNSLEELPVFKRGCDSSYSWSKKFHNLSRKGTPTEIVNELEKYLKNEFNPKGKFLHPRTKQYIHMAFTGGEPMLAQSSLIGILLEFFHRDNLPPFVTVETNGTIPLREDLEFIIRFFYPHHSDESEFPTNITKLEVEKNDSYRKNNFNQKEFQREWFWSVSPKLSISGEKWEDAIKPEVVKQYAKVSDNGQLKFVVDGSKKIWDEVEKAVDIYRDYDIDWDVWIMPVGATKEDQETIQAEISEEALKRGYYVAPRVHCWVFGNRIGK